MRRNTNKTKIKYFFFRFEQRLVHILPQKLKLNLKSKILIIATVLIGVQVIIALTALAADPVILYWNFDEGVGTAIHDRINHHDGTLSNATWERNIQIDNKQNTYSLYFNGSNATVSRTYASDTDLDAGTNSLSVSAWFRHNLSAPANGTVQILIARFNAGGYKLYMNSSGQMCFGIDDDGTSFPSDFTCSAASYNDSKWHHVEAVKSGTSSLTLYMNGLPNGTADSSITNSSISGTTPAFAVGTDSDGTSSPWAGYIDEVKVYNTARTLVQVKSDRVAKGTFSGGPATFGRNDPYSSISNGLVAYWKMDETSAGSSAVSRLDSSGNGNTLTDVSPYAASGVGRFGNAVNLVSANTEFLYSTDNPDLSTGNIDWTISTWVYLSTTASQDIASKYGAGTGADKEWILKTTGASMASLVWYTDNAGSNQAVTASNFGALSQNTWYFIMAYHNASNNTIGISVNNSIPNTQPATGGNDGAGNFYAGYNAAGLNGRLDDLRIYKRILSPYEAEQLYNWGPAPVAWWKFDEVVNGNTTPDSSGNGLTGTLNAMSANDLVPGVINKGFKYRDNDNYISLADNDLLDGDTGVTVEAWVKVNTTALQQQFINHENYGFTGYTLMLSDSSQNFMFRISGGTNQVATAFCTGIWPAAGYWYHVSGTYDPLSRNLTCRVNGIDMYDTAGTQGTLAMGKSAEEFRMGAYWSDYDIKGSMDDVRIYNYVRTPEQIIQDMYAGKSAAEEHPYGPAMYFPFDEGYGDTAHNTSVNGLYYSGNLAGTGACPGHANCPTWTNTAKYGKALTFDGTNDFVNIGSDNITDNTAHLSWSFWLKPQTLTTDDIIISRIENSNSVWGIATDSTTASSIKVMIAPDLASGGNYGVSPAGTLVNGQWTHIVVVYDGTQTINATRLKIYRNGKLIPLSFTGTIPALITDVNGAINETIGGFSWISGYSFNGTIDEFKIYPSSLSPQDVIKDYNRGASAAMGALHIDPSGIPSISDDKAYCVPGGTDTCTPPVGEWKFDEGSGSTAYDTSGNNNNNTIVAAPDWVNGKYGKALDFEADSSQYTYTADSTSLSLTGSLAIEAWIKPESITDATQFDIAGKWDDANQSYLLAQYGDELRLYVDSSSNYSTTNAVNLIAGNWYHIVAIYNSTAQTVSFYVNGLPFAATVGGTIPASIGDDAGRFHIGSQDSTAGGSAPSNFYDGVIDQVVLFSGIRTAAQVAYDYNRGGPVAWYKLDECSGTTAYNSSRSSNGDAMGINGTITIGNGAGSTQDAAGTCTDSTNTHAWYNGQSGKLNSSLNLDGVDDNISIDDTAVLQFNTGTNDFSVFAWVKRSANNTVQYILGKEDADDDGWRLLFNANNTVTCSVDAIDITSLSTITDTNWHNIGCVVDRDGNGQIYLDSKANGNAIAINSEAMSTSSPITLGSRSYNSASTYLSGQLDDVRIYNYVLSPTQIRLLMNNNSAVRFTQ